jgi:glutathione S-transferase
VQDIVSFCSSANARPATQGDLIRLYDAPGACSLSRHIALLEAGLKATLVKVDTKTHKTAAGADFYAINPKG